VAKITSQVNFKAYDAKKNYWKEEQARVYESKRNEGSSACMDRRVAAYISGASNSHTDHSSSWLHSAQRRPIYRCTANKFIGKKFFCNKRTKYIVSRNVANMQPNSTQLNKNSAPNFVEGEDVRRARHQVNLVVSFISWYSADESLSLTWNTL
jgi:hypothetical protein